MTDGMHMAACATAPLTFNPVAHSGAAAQKSCATGYHLTSSGAAAQWRKRHFAPLVAPLRLGPRRDAEQAAPLDVRLR